MKPSWITDSINTGKLLNYQKYLLYTNQSISQPALQFEVMGECHSNIDKNTLNNKEYSVSEKKYGETCKSTDIFISPIEESTNKLTRIEDKKIVKTSHQDDNDSSEFHQSKLLTDQFFVNQSEPKISQTNKTIKEQNEDCIKNKTKNTVKTAADPNFLEEFYNNSRLHLISTLGAQYKQLVNELRENSNGNFPGRERLKEKGMLYYKTPFPALQILM